MRRSRLLLLIALFAASGSEAIECPDEAALHLFSVAGDFDVDVRSIAGLATLRETIKSATRHMDEPALHRACGRLSRHLFMDAYDLYGRDYDSDLRWSDDEIANLILEHPILSFCPVHAIQGNSWLPTKRYYPVPTEDLLRQAITGSVELRIVVSEQGAVESASVLQSSHSELEDVAIDTVMKFEYQPKLNSDLKPVQTEGVEATIVIDYFDLAWASGCRWTEE